MKTMDLIPATLAPFSIDGCVDFKNMEAHIAAAGLAGSN